MHVKYKGFCAWVLYEHDVLVMHGMVVKLNAHCGRDPLGYPHVNKSKLKWAIQPDSCQARVGQKGRTHVGPRFPFKMIVLVVV